MKNEYIIHLEWIDNGRLLCANRKITITDSEINKLTDFVLFDKNRKLIPVIKDV